MPRTPRFYCCCLLLLTLQNQKTTAEASTLHKDGYEIVHPRIERSSRFTKRSADDERENEIENGKDPIVVVIRTSNRTFYMDLHPEHDIMSPNLSVAVHHTTGTYRFRPNPQHQRSCLYRGRIISDTGGTAALSLCDNVRGSMYGLLVTPEKTYYIRPDYSRRIDREADDGSTVAHTIREASLPSGTTFCGVDQSKSRLSKRSFPYMDVTSYLRIKREPSKSGTKVIETAVFADTALYQMYSKRDPDNPEQAVTNMIMTIMNEVQLIYNYDSMKMHFKIVIVKLEIMKPGTKDVPDNASGDIDKYLDHFCLWQANKKPEEGQPGHWDHAVMLTGMNLYKEVDGEKNDKVLGLAWVNGMCRPMYSCTINEGQDFEAAYVIAHEMAHSMGVLHDGTGNSCDSDKFIMSDKTGPGKINWSTCSNIYLEKYFAHGQAKCLENEATPPSPELDFTQGKRPGQKYPPKVQCHLAMGNDYRPYVSAKSPFDNICRELWCYSGSWASPAHPALDGSSCGSDLECNQGNCISTVKPRDQVSVPGEVETEDPPTKRPSTGSRPREQPNGRSRSFMDRVTDFFKDVFKRVQNYFRNIG